MLCERVLVETDPTRAYARSTVNPSVETRSRVRPLLLRPGARFGCSNDGMCCSDLHLIGPLSSMESKLFGALDARLVEQTNGLRNLRTSHHEAVRTGDCVIIQEEMRFDRDDGECLWRAVDIFRVDGDAVVEHIQYCTGCWPPDQIARQAAEAPMVRW